MMSKALRPWRYSGHFAPYVTPYAINATKWSGVALMDAALNAFPYRLQLVCSWGVFDWSKTIKDEYYSY